jgi:hypothetical protein
MVKRVAMWTVKRALRKALLGLGLAAMVAFMVRETPSLIREMKIEMM